MMKDNLSFDDIPYFSIIIPTKNRSHLISEAVKSVLLQDFSDYEVIIIDNDDTDETEKVIKKFSDERIRYHRTGGLSMVENWEEGVKISIGKYLTVLEDKMSFRCRALSQMRKIIEDNGSNILVWGISSAPVENSVSSQVDIFKVDSHTLVLDYVEGKNPWKKLPRLINSCVSRNLLKEDSLIHKN